LDPKSDRSLAFLNGTIFFTLKTSSKHDHLAGITIDALADAVRSGSGRPVHVAKQLDDVIPAVLQITRRGDAVITLGAGSIGTLPAQLVEALKQREGAR